MRDEAWTHFRMTGAEILDGAAQADDELRRLLSESTSLVDAKLDTVEITEFSADFVVLSLRRPWLDRDLFNNRSWDFEAPLSTGDGDPEQRLPCYVVATLITRNITVSGKVRGEVPGRLRFLELTPILNAVPFRARIVDASAPMPENLASVEAIPVVSNISELISENQKNINSAENALKRNLDEQRDLKDMRRRRAGLTKKESATAVEVEKLRIAGLTIQLELKKVAVIPFGASKSKARLRAKRAENRRQMTQAKNQLKTIRARIATLPPKAQLGRSLRNLQKRIPQLNLRLDELRQALRRLNALASVQVAEGMNEVAYFCRDVPKAPDPDPELIRFGGLRGL